MIDWLDVIQECSKNMRGAILPLFGTADAKRGFGIGAGGDVMKKIDIVAERELIQTLQSLDVSCTLVSEEVGTIKIGPHPSNFYLTVDPLDGTNNAIRGLCFIASSIAVSRTPHLQDVETALVSDLFHGISYTAKRGQGSFRDGKKIQTSLTSSLHEAVLGIDFNTFKIMELLSRLTPVLTGLGHTRHLGANALELCYVADGTIDAFIDLRGKLRVTDIAAAYLILKEAGGKITAPEGAELNVPLDASQRVSFIAANTQLYETISKSLNETKLNINLQNAAESVLE